jgi:hypothetical protein
LRGRFVVIFILIFASTSATGFAAPVRVDLGGLVLLVSDSPTAQIFHIVDQLSLWDVYTHKEYSRWAEKTRLLDQRDRELLQQHTEIRKKHGWGRGLEQTFLVDDSIENAAAKGVAAGLLSQEEGNAERDILLHFAPKLEPLLQERRGAIAAIQKEIVAERAQLSPLVKQLAHFGEVNEPPTVQAFLVSNAEDKDGGGGANGGRLVVEVPLRDPIGVLLHESLHQLLRSKEGAIKAAAAEAGIDFTLLKEGIAYALYPGVTATTDQGDQLAQDLVRMQLRNTPASDRFLQFDQLAIVIRPLLKAALAHDETITTFLPKATAKWRAVMTL